jgi:hypothetical protein
MPIEIDKTPSSMGERIISKIRRTIRDTQRARLRARFALSAPCLAPLPESRFSVHMLICKRDLLMGLCAAKSFALASGQFFRITFHDDGSLGTAEYSILKKHFPGCEIISYATSLNKAREIFGQESILYKYRLKGVMLLKLLDVKLFSTSPKAILLDSDILFFEKPEAILQAAVDLSSPNVFNKDIDTAYMMDKTYLESVTGYPLPEKLNAGLSVINVDVIDFKKISDWLLTIENSNQPFIMHRIEQTFIAMLTGGSKEGVSVLPQGYDVSLQKEVSASVCKHYVGIIRHGFELEGLRYLFNERYLEKRWQAFTERKVGK